MPEETPGDARSELAAAARVMSLNVLAASIAHEVSQPLSGIVTNARTCLRMLTRDPPDIDGARETALRTLRDSSRATDVISRIRALFSKEEAKKEPLDLNEVILEVIALSTSVLQGKAVVLQTELADDLPHVTGDRVQIQQALLNLLLNASDAMGDVQRPKRMLVTTRRDVNDYAHVSVQDVGMGLPPEGAGKLFEPFYTTKSKGMGIGLFVSRSIIEGHNGRLWAAQNDGPGATFSFSIPGVAR